MLTMEQIQEQVNEFQAKYSVKLDTWGTKKEFKALPEVLYDDEKIQYLTSGTLEGNTWMIACTNKRIVALDKGMIYGMNQQEIPLDKISSVSFKKGLMLASVDIITSSTKIKIDNIYKDQVGNFVKCINESIDALKNKSRSNTTTQVQEPIAKNTINDEIAQLEKLAQLKEKGIITEEEFQAKKKIILGI